jgi:hypothetical protein
MPVVCIRHVRVVVYERRVPVAVTVRFARGVIVPMVVLVVFIVHVEVFVVELVVGVLVAVPFAEQEPHASGHHEHR